MVLSYYSTVTWRVVTMMIREVGWEWLTFIYWPLEESMMICSRLNKLHSIRQKWINITLNTKSSGCRNSNLYMYMHNVICTCNISWQFLSFVQQQIILEISYDISGLLYDISSKIINYSYIGRNMFFFQSKINQQRFSKINSWNKKHNINCKH